MDVYRSENMRIAILESIVMPAGHEVEFDRILVEELKKQGHEPVFFVPERFPLSWIIIVMWITLMAGKSSPMPEREN